MVLQVKERQNSETGNTMETDASILTLRGLGFATTDFPPDVLTGQ